MEDAEVDLDVLDSSLDGELYTGHPDEGGGLYFAIGFITWRACHYIVCDRYFWIDETHRCVDRSDQEDAPVLGSPADGDSEGCVGNLSGLCI